MTEKILRKKYPNLIVFNSGGHRLGERVCNIYIKSITFVIIFLTKFTKTSADFRPENKYFVC